MNYDLKTFSSELLPREKLINNGPDSLSNAELLSTIFGTGTRNESVLDLSARIIKEYGSISLTNIRDVGEAMNLLGLQKVKACQLVAVFEIGRRFYRETNGKFPQIRGPEDVYEISGDIVRQNKEYIKGLYLNSRQKLIHEEIISVGSLNTNIISPREIFIPAVELSAMGVIVVHNHPSGDPTPSDEDIEFTKRIVNAGKLLGIQVMDHVVVARGGFSSIIDEVN